MNNNIYSTRLIQILRLLDDSELKSFGKWLQSPLVNPNKKLVELYLHLRKYHPDFNGKSLTKANLFSKLYPKKKFNDRWMRNMMGEMSKQVEKFLVHQGLDKNKDLYEELLAKEYLKRHRPDWYEKQSRQLIKKLEAREPKDVEEYLQLSLLHEELYYQTHELNPISNGLPPLQNSEVYLDKFYSLCKWRHLTELVDRQMIGQKKDEQKQKLELLNSLTIDLNLPAVDFLKERLNNTSKINQENYAHFKYNYFSNYERFSSKDRQLLMFYLINDVIRIWIAGHQEIISELFKLYKFSMKNNLLLHHGRLTISTYTNIVTTANSLGYFEYCNFFIENYTKTLAPEIREDGRRWASGHLFYKKNEFKKAIDLLSNHTFKESILKRNSRVLLLQSYYDECLKDETYILFFNDYCDAFKKSISRRKNKTHDRNAPFHALIKYAQKLLNTQMSDNYSRKDIEKIETKLEQEMSIQGKLWLKEKINEIKNGLPNN